MQTGHGHDSDMHDDPSTQELVPEAEPHAPRPPQPPRWSCNECGARLTPGDDNCGILAVSNMQEVAALRGCPRERQDGNATVLTEESAHFARSATCPQGGEPVAIE